jgi:hypothetical protein
LFKVNYNADGSNETTYYLSDNFVRVVNSSGNFDYTYVYHEGQQIAQLNPSDKKYFIHGNHEESSSVVTNSSGGVVERTEYSPFGELLSGGSKLRFEYTGKDLAEIYLQATGHIKLLNISLFLSSQPI